MVDRGLVASREKAQRLVMAGSVRVNGCPASKPSQAVKPEDELQLLAGEKYSSRGGLKLEAALDHFQISCKDLVCLDLGASTGGFTDCLLQRGARRVFAVDVGENQIAWKLRSDPRVIVLDKTNARHLNPAMLAEAPDLVTADVSFISLTKVLPAAAACARAGADFVVLIKPQFEAGRRQVGKGGVVRDTAVHEQVITTIRRFAEEGLHASWRGVIESPIRGPAGNVEFLAHMKLRIEN